MLFKRLATLTGLLAACAVIGSGPAHASVANTVESISLSGTFSSHGQVPFGSGAFTLNFSVPLTSFGANYGLSAVYGIASPMARVEPMTSAVRHRRSTIRRSLSREPHPRDWESVESLAITPSRQPFPAPPTPRSLPRHHRTGHHLHASAGNV